MQTVVRSFATRDGKAYYKHTGRYYEFKKSAKKKFINDSSSALKQNLVNYSDNSAAVITTKAAMKEFGL